MKVSGRKIFGIGLALLALFAVLLCGVHVWWLLKYGRSPQSIPSAILAVDKGFNHFPSDFPPDPGDAGKKTIQGIDADHDGVRDDVQRWIYAFAPNEPKKQMALRQMARWFQQYALADDYGPEVIARGWASVIRANQCMLDNFGVGHDELLADRYLQAKVLNTYSRVKRFYDNDSKITPDEVAGDLPDYKSPCDNR